ncbi:MAG: Rpn family recombination-promoting nuclease/putative transposase [Treponema sp.]|nr:Rpn family recombination-promoting nuclease/putative transposase [Treponema sp.]
MKKLYETGKKFRRNTSKTRIRAISKGMNTNEKNEPSRRLNPLNDFLFYKTMGEKGSEPQLIGFLNAVLAPSGRKPIRSLKIIEKKTFIKDLLKGKSCTLDVTAILTDKTRVNIEVQIEDKKNMDRRSLFYWSKLYAEVLKQGKDYRELPDAIAINIVDYDFPSGGGVHTRFRLRETSDPTVELTSAMEIHFVNMVKWRKQGVKDFAGNPLHRWLAWFDRLSSPELIEEVKNMDVSIAHADARQSFVIQDDEAREVYELLEKAERDRRSELAFALEKGEEMGAEKNALDNARNALAKGLSHELIHEITGVGMETIAGLSVGA